MKFKAFAIISLMVVAFSLLLMFVSQPVEAQGANTAACSSEILGIKPWHYYLDKSGAPDCDILAPSGFLDGNIPWLIAAAILEAALRIATYAAVVFVFAGGYQILASSGNPEAVAGGRKKIVSAIVGFIIAVTASSVIGYIMSQTVGSTVNNLPTGGDGGTTVVNFIFSLAYRIAAGLAVIYIAIAGIQFSTSGGDPGKVARARNSVMYAAIGLVIVIFAVAIISFIGGQL